MLHSYFPIISLRAAITFEVSKYFVDINNSIDFIIALIIIVTYWVLIGRSFLKYIYGTQKIQHIVQNYCL